MTVRRLVQITAVEGREPPPDLLARLREIDSTAELVYAGEGVWWLGAILLTPERVRDGALILYNEGLRGADANPRNVLLGKLAQQGFALVESYTELAGDPAGAVADSNGNVTGIVIDFSERDFAMRHDPEGAFRRRLDASALDADRAESTARMTDWLRTDGRAHYQREIRNRMVFGYGGASGGADKLKTA